MASAVHFRVEGDMLKDPRLKEQLQQLRQTDNITNTWYLLRTYLFLALVIGGTIWLYHQREAAEWSWWWNVPVTLLAVILVGAGQHQLSGLAHEGSHHILFRNRYLNELASDWLCMFPLFSATHFYRLQHLAHHQFVNDPVRDPDISQLQSSGHWLSFPLSKARLLGTLLRQLWPPKLIRFIRIRAQYNTRGADNNPYARKGQKRSPLPVALGVLYTGGLTGLLFWLVLQGDAFLLAVLPAAGWLAMMAFYVLIPAHWYTQSRVHAVYSIRVLSVLRLTYLTALFTALAWTALLTGAPVGWYFFWLWLVPIFTSFSFFMILRQLVQHGNCDRGWLTSTRVFFVHPFIRFSVFPMGQDFHLPHHLFATVPHYRLKRLHQVLLAYPEYQQQAVVIDGYFLPGKRPPTSPTVLDVLGPDYAPEGSQPAHIDNSVLEGVRVEEKECILREAEISSGQATAEGETASESAGLSHQG